MRNQLNVIHAIDKYLRGVLDESERQEFESRLKTDTQLQQEVAKQKLLMEGIKRSALTASVAKGKKKYKTIKTLKYVGVFMAVAAISAVSLYVMNQNESPANQETAPTTELGIESLPTQGYNLNTAQDTVIETENSSVFVIPADAFETESGEPVTGKVNFEIKEAFEDADIMKAGLTTTADGELLETGGMFFLDASQNGKPLRLKKGKEILSQLPNLQPEKDMKLFDGVTQEDGTINWVNPKEFEKDLITVDITSLDFYPLGYEEELSKTKITRNVPAPAATRAANKIYKSKILTAGFGFSGKQTNNYLAQDDAAGVVQETIGKKYYSKEFTDSLYYSFARLFERKAIAVSTENLKKVESKLSIISDKEMKDSSNYLSTHPANSDIIILWLNDGSQIKMSESYYFKKTNQIHDSLYSVYGCKLNVLKYKCDQPSGKGDSTIQSTPCPIPSGINPAKVKAIWNKKFNKTILATKEFEERMKVIHESRQDRILEVYVNNLDKPLWYSDSIAMITFSETKEKFKAFYEQRKGGVQVNDRLANKLTKYFAKKHKEFTTKSSEAFNEYESNKRKLRAEFANKKSKKEVEEFNRKAKAFEEEYEINRCDAYSQIYANYDCNQKPIPTVNVRIASLGPKNLDVYVFEATRDRKTMNYTDPASGKKAVLVYKPVKAKITNSEKFDKVFVYMLPDSLSSFNRMNTSDNINFDFSLNMLFKYKLMAIAYKGKQAYIAEVESVSPKEYALTLTAITESELKQKLNRTKSKVKEEITSDKDFYEEEMVNTSRERKYKADGQLTLRIGQFLFPEVSENCLEGGIVGFNEFENSGLFDPQ